MAVNTCHSVRIDVCHGETKNSQDQRLCEQDQDTNDGV